MSEQIVHVTPQGEIIGPIDRDEAHHNFILHAVVFAFLLTPQDSSSSIGGGWFIQRGENVEAYPGLTSVPAGHIVYQPGKNLFELGKVNVQRELQQEVGLNRIHAPVDLVKTGFLKTDTEQQFMLIYKARVGKNLPIKRQINEVKRAEHLSLSQVRQLIEVGKVSPFAIEAMRLIGLI